MHTLGTGACIKGCLADHARLSPWPLLQASEQLHDYADALQLLGVGPTLRVEVRHASNVYAYVHFLLQA